LVKKTIFLILFVILFLLAFPFLWARVLNKTESPKLDNPQFIFSPKNLEKNQLTFEKPLEVAVIGDSTAIGQGADSVKNSFSYQYLDNFAKNNRQIEYSNFAVSGSRIDQVLESQVNKIPKTVDLIFISVGANDVTAIFSENQFEDKVKQLIQKLKNFNALVVWLSIPDFITVPILLPPLNYFLSLRAKTFNAIIKTFIIQEKDFVYIDIYNETRQEFKNNPKTMFSKDKYHPSKDGYKLWAEIINKTILKTQNDIFNRGNR
jgi:lysophospholipase L1-like esterase